MKKLTAIIPTFNEEENIKRALESISFADEIIVIDSFSTDKTVEIVKKYPNVILLQRKFDDFSTQKNYAIDSASNEWIFLLDADEQITTILEEEIKNKLKNSNGFSAFYVYRSFFFKQKKINFTGWQRDKVIRLFKKNSNTYEGKVHEQIKTDGEIGFLKEKLNHFSYKNYNHYKQKLNHYAALRAEELIVKKAVVTPYHLLLKPVIRFFIQYVIKLGVLDGFEGFLISYLQAYGVYKRYLELLKLKYSNPVSILRNHKLQFYNKAVSHKNIDVSIIIVNYKSWIDLNNCLESICKIDSNNFKMEIIVVDNYSNDGKIIDFSNKFKGVQFIQNSGNNGFANGCNLGAAYSKGNYYLFLNPDTIANESSIAALFKLSKQNNNFGVISCNQKNIKGNEEDKVRVFPSFVTLFSVFKFFYKNINSKYNQQITSSDQLIFTDWVSGSLVFISKKWFKNINGWNEDYWMYFEDVDLSKKVTNLKGKVVVIDNESIIHNHGGASRINIKIAALTKSEVIISRHIYFNTHFSGFYKFICQFLLVVKNIIIKSILGILGLLFCFIPKAAVQWYLFINILKYYFSSLKNSTWLSERSMNFKT